MNEDRKGNYAEVNSLKMYYEIYGTGRPLILLHGGVGVIDMPLYTCLSKVQNAAIASYSA